MKVCTKCHKEKQETEFNWRNKEKGTRQWVCRECHSSYLKEHYKKNPKTYLDSSKKTKQKVSDFIRQAKNKPCVDCGIQYPYYVMDFDHLGDKKFNLSGGARTGSLEKVTLEIAKCDVVCANCHRERTFGRVA